MAFEERGQGRYYYRKVWRDGTCVSEYVGSGWLADLAHVMDGKERHDRTMARLDLQEFIEGQQGIDQAMDRYRAEVRGVVAAVLHRLGFHQHKRQWRKARKMTNKVANKTKDEVDEYIELWRAAEGKTKGPAIDRLRDYANAHPAIFERVSMLARSTTRDVIESASEQETTRIVIKGEVDALKRSLGLETATPLERLLIEDVVLCWLRIQIYEQLYTATWNQQASMSLAKADFLERKLSATRRRYHQSVESLARVRGLLARVGVQINVANQQVVQNG